MTAAPTQELDRRDVEAPVGRPGTLAIAIVVSLFIHAFLFVPMFTEAMRGRSLAMAPREDFNPEALRDRENERKRTPEEERIEKEEEIRLGIAKSANATVNWIGYEDYQEHLAQLAEIEQAALRVNIAGDEGVATAPTSGPPGPDATAVASAPAPAVEATPETATPDTPAAAKPENETTKSPPAPAEPATAPPPPATEPVDHPAPTPESPPTPEPAPVPEPRSDPVPTPEPVPTPAPMPEPSTIPDPSAPQPPSDPEPDPIPVATPSAVPPPTAPAPEPAPDPAPASAPEPQPEPQTGPELPPEPTAKPTPNQDPSEEPSEEPSEAPAAEPSNQPIRPPSSPSPPPAAASPAGTSAPDPVGTGDISDSESDPTSLQSVPASQWKNGRPIAAQGLAIKTRKPRFTTLTMVTANPRNPIVEIRFEKDGKPSKITFLRSSGHQDIDGPILDAITGWRASGKALEKLKAGDSVAIKLRLVLVG
ncbi:MAG: hypothetical protein SGJ09_14050 [Phycisphaerae bacterium]|nr:hypothetical protein [Phycisphaerae bacterium]